MGGFGICSRFTGEITLSIRTVVAAITAAAIALSLSPVFGSLPAHAAPVVEIRARTVIDLHPIVRTQGGIIISGQVTDRASPQPVPFAAVIIDLDGFPTAVVADEQGRFRIELPTEEGRHTIAVRFPGDRYFDSSTENLENFDVANEPLDLRVSANPIDQQTWEITVRTSSAGQPVSVSINLWGGDLTATELTRFGMVTTDLRGRAGQRVVLESAGHDLDETTTDDKGSC